MSDWEPGEWLSRDMGCTVDDLLRWLPGAVGHLPITWRGPATCAVALGQGEVVLAWVVLPPRRIALVSIQRLQLEITGWGCDGAEWAAFIAHFDAYTRRGGG